MNRVVALHLADVFFPPGHPQEGEWGPVRAFLITTPSGAMVFDTGVGATDQEIDRWFRPRRTTLRNALAAHGVDISDVRAVANSHLHFDHCGENARFPGVPIYVQREESPRGTSRRWWTRPEGPWSSPARPCTPGANRRGRRTRGGRASPPRGTRRPTPGRCSGSGSSARLACCSPTTGTTGSPHRPEPRRSPDRFVPVAVKTSASTNIPLTLPKRPSKLGRFAPAGGEEPRPAMPATDKRAFHHQSPHQRGDRDDEACADHGRGGPRLPQL